MHLSSYLSIASNTSLELKKSIEKTSFEILEKINSHFDYKSHCTGLLLGNVQSGKTAQMFGAISKLADDGLEIFLILTTDNVYLQKQTYERALKSLITFEIIGENADIKLLKSDLKRPLLIIIKKNTNVLRRWRNLFSSSGLCEGRPLVIIDDEADAASLNTLVNKNKQSTINKHLSSLRNLFSSSIYLQVTATPQAIILQTNISGWKPDFITYFKPGSNYLGGDFFYSEPRSFCIRTTKEDELDDIKKTENYIPEGLQNSLLTFLLTCAHLYKNNETLCNFLIHPSVRIFDHEAFANTLGEHLNSLISSINEATTKEWFEQNLKEIWNDLQTTKPDITNFEDLCPIVFNLLIEQKINIYVINSYSSIDIDYEHGFNIVIGGNSLGRGVTLPQIQTIYYCRRSKSPQADTYWQHSRMFGYDRYIGLLRLYLPQSLLHLFTEINNSNKVLIEQVQSNSIEKIQLIFPNDIRPTRKSVIDNKALRMIIGGVNFFPEFPIENFTAELDLVLTDFKDSTPFTIITSNQLIDILQNVGSTTSLDWDKEKFINCIVALNLKRPSLKYCIIVRRDREISKGTGTLLSPTDRKLGDKLGEYTVLTLYRVNGSKSKGWNGFPLWIPNIKFPESICFYDTIDI